MAGKKLSAVEDGAVVGIYYTLKNEQGDVLDTNRKGGSPLAYLHGRGNLVPGLEKALTGATVGQKVEATVAPEDGYGEPKEELVDEVPRLVGLLNEEGPALPAEDPPLGDIREPAGEEHGDGAGPSQKLGAVLVELRGTGQLRQLAQLVSVQQAEVGKLDYLWRRLGLRRWLRRVLQGFRLASPARKSGEGYAHCCDSSTHFHNLQFTPPGPGRPCFRCSPSMY